MMNEYIQTADQQNPDAMPIPVDYLREHARIAAQNWAVTRHLQKHRSFSLRLEAVQKSLVLLCSRLDSLPAPDYSKIATPDPILELRENPRLLRATFLESKPLGRAVKRLPRVVSRTAQASGHPDELSGGRPRVIAIATSFLDATHSAWNNDAFRIYIDQIQQDTTLDLEEIWSLPSALRFQLLESVVADAQGLLDNPAAYEGLMQLLSVRIKTLREVGFVQWADLLEPLILFDATLRQDPARCYADMDVETRDQYRGRVAEYARHSECDELQVAAMALALARNAQESTIDDQRVHLRRSHVGYYLIDKGFEQLSNRIGYHAPFMERVRSVIRKRADDFYLGGIEVITIFLMAAIITPLAARYPVVGGLTVAFLLLLLPAAQGAIDLFNNTVTALFKASPLPKLDFSKGIPDAFATLVAVPTLLSNEKQLLELVEDLDVRFLANKDSNLYFALVTDLPDAVARPRTNDSDPIVDLAHSLIDGLNSRYRDEHGGPFFLLHRHRIFNSRQGVWMGWERKRGKLLDLNKYLQGDFDAFPVKAGDLDLLQRVRYIITLDSDTQLPHGTAARLVGAIAHPLNRAIIDAKHRIVTQGYGILQPRVGVSVSSASRSRLASIYSGQTGFDIYARAVSDAYQDLYGDGIFTGKGIYEVAAFHAVLDHRFPRNSLLSHDLIEGSYLRVGLATDIEVIDDYPSHYSAYTRRKHRWVRGDWQIAQWMFSRVPDESGRYVPNPISTISRWRILDNLRRSLSDPATFVLFAAGWLGLPGGPLYWMLATLLIFFLPNFVQLFFSLGYAIGDDQEGSIREAIAGSLQAFGVSFLALAFLPHQTLLSIDAIVRSLVRRFVTGKRLLEWETAAEAESSIKLNKRATVDTYLAVTPLIAALLAAIVWSFNWGALHIAAPMLVLWGFIGSVTAWLNAPPREQHSRLQPRDEAFLRQEALRIWRFYAEFSDEKHRYLIPDNVEEASLHEAPRVSTTNIGMLLNARQAAMQFGFITITEFADLTARSLASIQAMEKLNGHLYNWYDTQTLAPLLPITISSVDNGNLTASLYTLRAGVLSVLKRPLVGQHLFGGLHVYRELLAESDVSALIKEKPLPREDAELGDWILWVTEAAALNSIVENPDIAEEPSWWSGEFKLRLAAIENLVRCYQPWMLPKFAALRMLPELRINGASVALADLPCFASDLLDRLERIIATSAEGTTGSLGKELLALLPDVIEKLRSLNASLRKIADDAFTLVEQMDFGFLLEENRQLLSIGYETSTRKLQGATYDMLASEARIATFLAIAKGDIPQQSWLRLSRAHTIAFGRPVLLSWTGTMFEYLMPALWMRSYPDTLVARTLTAVIEIQRVFARKLNIPWGISESGYTRQDTAGHYQYRAFGIPDLALKWDVTAGPVVSPYSSFLALAIDAPEAIKNLRHMARLGWIGAYGFYESADYSQSRAKPQLVREWMAHHQGMCLLAILNLLQENIVQEWFHSNPQVQASEQLLHEKPARDSVLRAENKQFAFKGIRRVSP